MFDCLMADFRHKQRIYQTDGARVSMLKMLLSDGAGAIVLYRLMRLCAQRAWLWPLAVCFQYLNKLFNHCIIGLGADFAPGLVLMHPTGVVINSKVRGGQRIVIESSVVIGDEKGRSPQLGSDIFIGAGAKIIGGVQVGDHIKIGANAVVVHDTGSYATWVGVPARALVRAVESQDDPA